MSNFPDMLRRLSVKTKDSNYITWFVIINIIPFILGVIDSGSYVTYDATGGIGSRYLFSLIGTYIGCILGTIYIFKNLKNNISSQKAKLIQIIISISSILFPVLALFGAVVGWVVGSNLMKLLIYFLERYFT